jgi:hypothetical protein
LEGGLAKTVRPDKTRVGTHPWSYPKRRKPVVATVEIASERGLPERPINLGGAIVDVFSGE